jgi:hypothetical protein
MKHRRFALSTFAALCGIALVSGGCQDVATLNTPAAPEAPRYTTEGQPIRLLRGSAPAAAPDSVVQTIGALGGELKLGTHKLSVPAGAVAAPTVFTMRLVRQDEGTSYVEVDLSAHRDLADGTRISVGTPTAPFLQPLNLKLDYALLTEPSTAERLVVVYLVNDRASGALEAQPTLVAQNSQWVIAKLTHFSRYIIGEM